MDADPVTSAAFRAAMAEVTAAVHVIATRHDGAPSGLTASAVTSLSDQPAMMLACIRADSHTLAHIEASGVFAINALAGDQQAVAEAFAGRRGLEGAERFTIGRWASLVTGSPTLEDALATFDCRLVEARTIATHRVIVGQVLALAARSADHPPGLIYRNRRFGQF
jgi:flavin reductase (DIM6/NTAB) family NADH-FMN oxidoreductase RutF